MPMLPWPIWPLAWQARLGQNTVAGSTAVLLRLVVKWIHRSMLGSPFASQWRPTTVRCGATQSQVSVKYLRKLMGAKLFDNPKDHEEVAKLVKYMLGASSAEIVVDF